MITKMVPEAGLEPAQSYDREILSLLCLPIPPLGLTGVFFIAGLGQPCVNNDLLKAHRLRNALENRHCRV